jgi:hypothetical protein
LVGGRLEPVKSDIIQDVDLTRKVTENTLFLTIITSYPCKDFIYFSLGNSAKNKFLLSLMA